jgi:hypothetical protein
VIEANVKKPKRSVPSEKQNKEHNTHTHTKCKKKLLVLRENKGLQFSRLGITIIIIVDTHMQPKQREREAIE